MNEVIRQLFDRRSVRSFEDRPIPQEDKILILEAAMQAPTAGNQQLYTILDITEQKLKEQLAITCDDQPFIARAPMILIFCADWQGDAFPERRMPEISCLPSAMPISLRRMRLSLPTALGSVPVISGILWSGMRSM